MKLYRKRLIPQEIVELKGDVIVSCDEEKIITKWEVLRPRDDFDHGCSCYFLKEGFKLSRFLRRDGSLKCWYCDIISYDKEEDGYVFTDLLADVILTEDGCVQVVDLDELADAQEQKLITTKELTEALRKLDHLLQKIYHGDFEAYQKVLKDSSDCT